MFLTVTAIRTDALHIYIYNSWYYLLWYNHSVIPRILRVTIYGASMISWWLNPHCIPRSWWRFAASACWSRSFSSAWGANRTPTEETSKTSFRRKPSRTRAFLYVFNCFNGCLTKKKWCFSTKTAISNQELGLFRSGLDRMECRNPGDWWLMTPTGVSSIFWTWHM